MLLNVDTLPPPSVSLKPNLSFQCQKITQAGVWWMNMPWSKCPNKAANLQELLCEAEALSVLILYLFTLKLIQVNSGQIETIQAS